MDEPPCHVTLGSDGFPTTASTNATRAEEVKPTNSTTLMTEPKQPSAGKCEESTCSSKPNPAMTGTAILTRDAVGMYPRHWKSIQQAGSGSDIVGCPAVNSPNSAADPSSTSKGIKRPLEDRETPERRTATTEQRNPTEATSAENGARSEGGAARAAVDQGEGGASAAGAMSFRLATYNILTDNCIRAGQYLHCAEQIRYMPSRHGHIMDEVAVLSPDIICFQEADETHYPSRLAPSMAQKGYRGVHAPTADRQGLAIFWRESVFELVAQRARLTHDAADDLIKTSASLEAPQAAAVREAIVRPEMSLGVRLRHLASGRELVVVTVHIAWTELRWPALQTLQIAMGVKMLRELSANSVASPAVHATDLGQVKGEEFGKECPGIICGDFNTPPHFPAYRMMGGERVTSSSFQQLEHIRNNAYCGDEAGRLKAYELADVLPEVYRLSADTQLRSAYKTVLVRSGS